MLYYVSKNVNICKYECKNEISNCESVNKTAYKIVVMYLLLLVHVEKICVASFRFFCIWLVTSYVTRMRNACTSLNTETIVW